MFIKCVLEIFIIKYLLYECIVEIIIIWIVFVGMLKALHCLDG